MKQILRMVFFVMVLGTILTAILLTVDYFAAPVIEANARITIRENVLTALGVQWDGQDVDALFEQRVERREVDAVELFVSGDGTRAIAYEGSGLWGPISGILSVSPDGQTIKRVTIIHQEETPGLGGRIAEPEYLDTFTGLPLDTPMEVLAPGKATAVHELDAITGATLSTVAFIDILNARIAETLAVLQGDS